MASTMNIVLYCPARLPVREYGGTERVVVWLARGLAERGHRVTVIALPGTKLPSATVIPIPNKLALQDGGPDLTPLLPPGTDIVHAHSPLKRPPEGVPFVWTFHGNGAPGRVFTPNTIGLSADHAARHGLKMWVHNGLDPDEYRFSATKLPRDLFLGRLHTVKGWDWAVRGARLAGRPLVVAGGGGPSIRPGLRFVGQVGGEEKMQLLAESACLWVPAQWDEPFGLTTIEAMVSGTPVLGTRRGALPEVISPESGAMGSSVDELAALRSTLDALDPAAIRQHVLDHFTYRTMAARYEAIYSASIGRG